MLGASADELWMQPGASLQVTGIASEDVFFKRFFDKYGVKADYQQRYEYKNAVNPYLYSDYTAPHRESQLSWMGSIYGSALASAATDRKQTPQVLRTNLEAGPYLAEDALKLKLIDKVAAARGRRLLEVPVGFKWFVPGLMDGTVGFGGEESAGASFLTRDGSTWTTDKDGILLCLLAAEIAAVTGLTPSQRFDELTAEFGSSAYARIDAPATREQKAALKKLSPAQVTADALAGEAITAKLTEAPGNGAAIGGLKVTTESAWFAARPSGTEDVYKIYAESFRGEEHLAQVQQEAKAVVDAVIGS